MTECHNTLPVATLAKRMAEAIRLRHSLLSFSFLLGCMVFLGGCLPATTRGGRGIDPSLRGVAALSVESGEASYYGDEFDGRTTANGETFHQEEMTAAHRTYPFGTIVRVINVKNGRETAVRINDRGPQKQSRVIDLTRHAAEELGMLEAGTAQVRLEVLRWGS